MDKETVDLVVQALTGIPGAAEQLLRYEAIERQNARSVREGLLTAPVEERPASKTMEIPAERVPETRTLPPERPSEKQLLVGHVGRQPDVPATPAPKPAEKPVRKADALPSEPSVKCRVFQESMTMAEFQSHRCPSNAGRDRLFREERLAASRNTLPSDPRENPLSWLKCRRWTVTHSRVYGR